MFQNINLASATSELRCYSLSNERGTRSHSHLKTCPPPRIFPSSGSALTVSGPTTSAASTNGPRNQKLIPPLKTCNAMESFRAIAKLSLRTISATTISPTDGANCSAEGRNSRSKKKRRTPSSRCVPLRPQNSRQSARWIVREMLAENACRQGVESNQASKQKSTPPRRRVNGEAGS